MLQERDCRRRVAGAGISGRELQEQGFQKQLVRVARAGIPGEGLQGRDSRKRGPGGDSNTRVACSWIPGGGLQEMDSRRKLAGEEFQTEGCRRRIPFSRRGLFSTIVDF